MVLVQEQPSSVRETVQGGFAEVASERPGRSLADRAVLGDAADAVSHVLDDVAEAADRGQLQRSTQERSRYAAQRRQASEDRWTAAEDPAAAEAEIAGLREALGQRGVVGQAVGIIMASQHVDADEAFMRLVRRSQKEHIKIRELAPRLVDEAVRSWTSEKPKR